MKSCINKGKTRTYIYIFRDDYGLLDFQKNSNYKYSQKNTLSRKSSFLTVHITDNERAVLLQIKLYHNKSNYERRSYNGEFL